MDITQIEIKYRKNQNGTQVIAYCDEYPQVTGNGPDEQHATNSFWKAFNSFQIKQEQKASELRRSSAVAETDTKKKKKAA